MDLHIDEDGIGDHPYRIPWDQILALGIRTTADGPFGEDLFWQLLLREGELLELPGAFVDGAALGVLHDRLPGLDDRKIIAAMGSTEARVWRLWHKDAARPDAAALRARFGALIARLGGQRADAIFDRLLAAWDEPHRRYHDRDHLIECLGELDSAHAVRSIADVAELALFYHDAIYRPRARDNEEASAAWLLEDAGVLQIPRDVTEAAARCVCATTHRAPRSAAEPTIDLVLDVDLAILAADPLRFLEFEFAVAEEYATGWETAFLLARGRFFARLLASPAIYRTTHFRERCEARARRNLEGLLNSPRYRAHRWLGPIYRCFAEPCMRTRYAAADSPKPTNQA